MQGSHPLGHITAWGSLAPACHLRYGLPYTDSLLGQMPGVTPSDDEVNKHRPWPYTLEPKTQSRFWPQRTNQFQGATPLILQKGLEHRKVKSVGAQTHSSHITTTHYIFLSFLIEQ